MRIYHKQIINNTHTNAVRSVESPRTKLLSLKNILQPLVKQVTFDPLLENSNISSPGVPATCLVPRSRRRKRNGSFDLVGIELNPGPSDTMVPYGGRSTVATAVRQLIPLIPSIIDTYYKYGPAVKQVGNSVGQVMSKRPYLVGVETNPGPKSTRKPKSKKSAKRRVNAGGRQSMMTVSAPSSISTVMQGSSFNVSGSPTRADVSMSGAVRISGHGLTTFNAQVISTATNQNGLTAMTGANGFFKPFGLSSLDTRVAGIGSVYNYYVIRYLKITYIPSCPTTTTGAAFLAISEDSDFAQQLITGSALNPQTLIEFNSSVMAPLWQPAFLEYKNMSGQRVFHNDTMATSIDNIQLNFIASTSNPALSVLYGYYRVDYVVDLYDPVAFHSVP